MKLNIKQRPNSVFVSSYSNEHKAFYGDKHIPTLGEDFAKMQTKLNYKHVPMVR